MTTEQSSLGEVVRLLTRFGFTAFGGPAARIVPYIRRSPWWAAFSDGVNVTAWGLMAGVTLQLGRAAIVDLPTLALTVVGAVLLFRFRINSAWLVLAGGVLGLARLYTG